VDWSAEAEKALKEVPFFVRPAVRKRIESMARDTGRTTIDVDFYAEAKAQFGSK